jgi:hypothetical protein
MSKIAPKDKCIHRHKHDFMCNICIVICAIVGLLEAIGGGGRGKENDRVTNIKIH